jgi:hypothetical protein
MDPIDFNTKMYLPFKILAVITHTIVGVGSGTVYYDSDV